MGGVIEKGIPIIEDTLAIGELTATRHANGRDWWILMPEYNSNRFYRILLNENGVNLLDGQTVGTLTNWFRASLFSPNGNWYTRNNMLGNSEVDDYMDIYRFDRCSGLLSEHLWFSLSLHLEQQGIYFYSIESNKQRLGSGKLIISR